MRRLLAFAALVVSAPALPAAANAERETAVAERAEAGADRTLGAHSFATPEGAAAYGPFRVLDAGRAALVDATDESAPRLFAAMLRDHPGITTIELIECPGTDDDTANLALGRMIRARGIATHVPSNGSVRSGAIELFLAGARRTIDDGAEFAVHAWRDSDGREPGDYAADSPFNRAYVEYYGEMGLARPQAFYDMTNAVPNDTARWLTARDMRGWLGEGREGDVTVAVAPTLTYLDLGSRFP